MFYVVKRGKNPGIYNSWQECKEQVNKFPNAQFKKFSDYKIARLFFDDEPYKINKMNKYFKIDITVANNKIKSEKFIDDTIKSQKISDFFKVDSEPKTSINFFKNKPLESNVKNITIDKDITIDNDNNITIDKKYDSNKYDSNKYDSHLKNIIFRVPETVQNETVQNETVQKKSIKDIVRVYTDGSCINNGKINARGGIGVWFGENDPRNISAKLNAKRPTNQLAELTAILNALEIFSENIKDIKLIIYTDSEYSIKCITRYCKLWSNNNWKKKDGNPIKNLDTIRTIYNFYLNYMNNICFVHVKAHTKRTDRDSYGNNMADKLAVAGANSIN